MPTPVELTSKVTYLIEIGLNGFNAYRVEPTGEKTLFAASSSVSTFFRVAEYILNTHALEGKKQ